MEGVDHCVVYEDEKSDSDGQLFYSGVIDMTAVQFHDDPLVAAFEDEF